MTTDINDITKPQFSVGWIFCICGAMFWRIDNDKKGWFITEARSIGRDRFGHRQTPLSEAFQPVADAPERFKRKKDAIAWLQEHKVPAAWEEELPAYLLYRIKHYEQIRDMAIKEIDVAREALNNLARKHGVA